VTADGPNETGFDDFEDDADELDDAESADAGDRDDDTEPEADASEPEAASDAAGDDDEALPEIPTGQESVPQAPPPPLPFTPTTATIARLSERSLSRTVGMNAYQKGRGYARRGNVLDASVEGWVARGRVHGRAAAPYDVQVTLQESGAFQSSCTCPAWRGPERHCKHVAALLVSLRDRMKPYRETLLAQQTQSAHGKSRHDDDHRGGRRRRGRHGEVDVSGPREVVVVDRSGPRVVSTHTASPATVQVGGSGAVAPLEMRTGWQTWLPADDPKRAPEFEYRLQLRSMAFSVAVFPNEARAPVNPDAAIDMLGPFVSAHRPILRALSRSIRGGRQTTVEVRGEDAAEILALLRGRRVLIEPNLMELRFVEDPLVPRIDLELAGPSGVRVKVVFERKSDARRFSVAQGLWFEGQPGWHVDTTQGIARPIAENLTPAWLERLSRAPSFTHPLEDMGRLLSEIIPKAAFALGTELPDLATIADLIDETPTFTLRAEGDLTRVRALLRVSYGDAEFDVPPADLPPPLAVMPSPAGGGRPKVIRRDVGAERVAANELFNLGLGLPEEHEQWFEASGDKAVTFWTEGVGSLPETWDKFIPEDLVSVTVRDTPVAVRARVSSGVDWLSLDVEFESEGSKVNEDDLRRAIHEGRKLVRLEDGTYAPVSREKVEEVLRQMAEIFAAGRGNVPLSQAGRVQELLRLVPGAKVEPSAKEILEQLGERSRIETVPVPKSLKATLRPYQADGFSWLAFLHRAKTGGVLADDMGLGKTLQTLALLVWTKEHADELFAESEAGAQATVVKRAKKAAKKADKEKDKEPDKEAETEAPTAKSAKTTTAGAPRASKKTLAIEEPAARKKTVTATALSAAPAAPKKSKKSVDKEADKTEAEPQAPEPVAPPAKAPLSLVVAPTSVVNNWMREVERFAPTLRAVAWTGPDREKRLHELDTADVVITSYALLRRDEEFLQKYEFAYAILDEAQNIKNPSSATARAAKKLRSKRRLALTGTPIENRLSEIWSIFDFLAPGMLGDLATFEERYARPIDRGDAEAIRRLRAAIHPLVLRRTKSEVAKDLPERIVSERECELPTAQRALYAQVLSQVRQSVFGEIDRVGINKSQIAILAGLTRLRQAACDPRLLKVPGNFTDEDSGKLDALMEILSEAMVSGHRTLVFSQFVEMLTLIRRALEKEGVRYEYLDGSTRDRMERVDHFNTDESVPVFLISLKAGGSGLNLTGADTVIHFDPWWNPAVEDQATDRAHRIGQTRVVTAYRLIARGTIEEKIMALSAKKRELVSNVLGAEENTVPKGLTRSDVEMLLADEVGAVATEA
jgi:superfamily II DNA or RNA helicase